MLSTAGYHLKQIRDVDDNHVRSRNTTHVSATDDGIRQSHALERGVSVKSNVDIKDTAYTLAETCGRRQRPPIKRPSERVYTGTHRTPTIIDRPMVTENREQRLVRQERFLWLCNAWSPAVDGAATDNAEIERGGLRDQHTFGCKHD